MYELDKWAPSVVKIAYKVRQGRFPLCRRPWSGLTMTASFFCLCAGDPRSAPWARASAPQREVQRLADHLRIHHQGQAHTGQGEGDQRIRRCFFSCLLTFLFLLETVLHFTSLF